MTPSTSLRKLRWFRFFEPEPSTGLLNDFCYNSSAYRSATFTDGETEAFFHCNVGDELDRHGIHIVTRHHHFHSARKSHHSGHIRRAEIELRAISVQERRMAAAFFLRQDIDLSGELLMRSDGSRFRDRKSTRLNSSHRQIPY